MNRKRTRVVAVAAVLLTAGFVVGFRLTLDRLDRAIPQTNLFETSPSPSSSMGPSPDGWDLTGPLDILIAGHDMVPTVFYRQVPRADAVMVLHIDASLTHAYLTSLPRDLLVPIPANPASGTSAHTNEKLTHAMYYGSLVPGGGPPNLAQGFALLARTVSAYTGIDHFDAGAILSFDGLSRLVDALGGIDMYVDEDLHSIHHRPDGTDAEGQTGGEWQRYPVGMFHFEGWQAIDYARQRYGLSDGAYGRERHQRQMICAIVGRLVDLDVVAQPRAATLVLAALGDTATVDLRGRQLHEYVYALRNLRPENLTLVGLPGGSLFSSGGGYLGERQDPIAADYFAAVQEDAVADFLEANPELVESFVEDVPQPSNTQG